MPNNNLPFVNPNFVHGWTGAGAKMLYLVLCKG